MYLRKLLAAAVPLVALAATATIAEALSVPPPTPVLVPCPPPSPSPSPSPSPTPSGATPSPTPSPTPTTPPPPCFTVSPSPFPTVLHTPPPALKPPPIHAPSAILEDLGTGQVLFAHNPNERRPIASVTKVMTALLVLSHDRPTDVVTVSEAAAALGRLGPGVSNLGLRLGERLSVQELLYALLLQSSNDVAVALADHVSGTEDAFVAAMNRKARDLGLHDTRFASASGLNDEGYSSAHDVAAIFERAFRFPTFAQVDGTQFATIPAPFGPPRHVQNRNVMLWLYPGAVGGKTGFTSRAGYCLVAAAKRDGRSEVAVVLGDATEDFSFDDGAALLDYGFHAFTRTRLVTAGVSLAQVPVGTISLPVRTGASLTRLIPVVQARHLAKRVRVLPGLHLPLPIGKHVGVLTVSARGNVLGRVPVSVAGLPVERAPAASTAAPSPPWWARGLSAAGRFTFRAFLSLFG